MKKILIILLIINSLIGYSQELLDFGIHSSISFEDTSEYKYILNDSNDIWYITKPNKDILFLPSDTSNEFALITDTNNYYADSIFSYFQFKLFINEEGMFDIYYIIFSHKYDFENNKDGGIIQTSYNNGETWQNILFDDHIQNLLLLHNFYCLTDTISSFNNQPGFTGIQDNLIDSDIAFYVDNEVRGDTMFLRFIIVSDSVDANNEGWMIDNIRFGWITEDAIFESVSRNTKVKIIPNPANDNININIDNEIMIYVEINSLQGEKCISKTDTNIESLDISKIPSGVYIVRCKTLNNKYFISKFIKQ